MLGCSKRQRSNRTGFKEASLQADWRQGIDKTKHMTLKAVDGVEKGRNLFRNQPGVAGQPPDCDPRLLLPPELSAPTPRQPGTAGCRFFLKEDRALVITYARGLLWVPVLMPLIIFCWQESHNGLRFLSSPSLSNIAADFDAYFVGLTLVLEAFVGLVALGLYANYRPDVRLFRYGAATRGRISRISRDSDQGPTVVEFEFVADRGKQRFGHYSPPAAFDPLGAGETVGVLFSDDVKYVAVFQSGKKMIRAATGKLPQDWAGKTWFERFLGPAMAAWVLTCMVGPLAGWIACSDGSSF